MNWGRSFLLGAALAGTAGLLTLDQLRPDARSEVASGSAPLIKAEPGPVKVKPQDPGGLKVPHKDKSIYAQIEGQRKVVPAATAPKGTDKKLAQAVGPYRVQLGSFDKAESAQKRWDELKSRHADLVGSLTMVLERVELKAKGTMYRLQAGPLKSPDEVQKLCTALSKRKVGCFLVKS